MRCPGSWDAICSAARGMEICWYGSEEACLRVLMRKRLANVGDLFADCVVTVRSYPETDFRICQLSYYSFQAIEMFETDSRLVVRLHEKNGTSV